VRVLRISHSAVVAAWRERERALVRLGVDVALVTAKVWDEGGAAVPFAPEGDTFAQGARTVGTHPNVFLFDPRPIWRLLGQRWDVIDIHEEPCSLAAAEVLLLRLIRRSQAPFVLYSAQNIAKRYPPPFRWIERWTLRRTGGVSVCNHAAGEILTDKGLTGVVAEIPLGVDVEAFTPTERGAPSGQLRIGYVGRLAQHKGVQVLLDSVAERPEWTAELVGAGPAEADLRAQARRLGIEARVEFVGSLDQDALMARYRSLDVVVVPSIPTTGWLEQFCRVAVEAMASGVPVVASRSGALPDVVGDAALLFEPGSVQGLTAALDHLIGEPGCWSAQRAAGLARAQQFTWDAVADAYVSLYGKLRP
jgi:glycosyltransferase involved in cell wall biosynthesis